MSVEHKTLQMLECEATAYGEIHSITTDSIEIRGDFTPGQSLVLRPGAKVFILTADDAIDVLDGFANAAVDAANEAAAEAARGAAKKPKRGGK